MPVDMPAEQTVDLARTADAPTQAAEAAQAGEAAQAAEAAEAQALAGLDNLDSYEVVRTPLWKRSLKAAYPPVLAVVIIIAVWQAFYAADIATSDTLPAPIDVWHAITGFDHRGLLWPAIFGSLHYGALGFLIAAAIGTPLGLALGRIPWLRAGIGPIVTGLQNLPSVAWVPVAIIWFHLSPGTKFFVVIIGATPSIANGMVSGLDQVPPIFLRVGHVLGARGLTLARHVLLPAVLPAYIGGLRQGWAFAWRSLMAAEIIAASLGHGLGQLLSQAQDTASISQGLAVIVLILVVGIAVEVLIFRPLERTVLRRRGLALAR